uniref:MARVEL domain-containing protein n=1 Tax=Gasterosteus aculeatus aculeatus TaxID=481459 RepID=A0AAQ4RFW9_GASAC|nr:myeloid-associated differentiation marker-like [Gasterosteus aculeatus aculeatus]
MIVVDPRALTQPVGVVRLMATVFTCVSFSLVASAGHVVSSPYWAWCMFTWCFCFFFTLLILVLEFTSVHAKLPFAWDDFTTAFALLASLMCLSVSIMYPVFFTCQACPRQIGASVVSWVCFGFYAAEAVLTRLRPSGQNSGFLSSLPGIMKMLEAFLACLIFTSLENSQYVGSPGLQWCVAVYCLCFIFAILVIILSAGRLASFFPFPFEKLVIVYNILAAVMYLTATVIWPLYSLRGNKRPSNCGHLCAWDKLVVVTFMTILNVIVYTLDTAYSILLVFCVRSQ